MMMMMMMMCTRSCKQLTGCHHRTCLKSLPVDCTACCMTTLTPVLIATRDTSDQHSFIWCEWRLTFVTCSGPVHVIIVEHVDES